MADIIVSTKMARIAVWIWVQNTAIAALVQQNLPIHILKRNAAAKRMTTSVVPLQQVQTKIRTWILIAMASFPMNPFHAVAFTFQ